MAWLGTIGSLAMLAAIPRGSIDWSTFAIRNVAFGQSRLQAVEGFFLRLWQRVLLYPKISAALAPQFFAT